MFKNTPAIVSIKTTTLSEDERTMLKIYNPLGVILMERNVESKTQLRALCEDLRSCVPYLLVDQEGGAVRRLRSSEFYDAKSMAYFGALYDEDPDQAIQELTEQTRHVAQDLNDCFINVNCAPCLDLEYEHPAKKKHVISFYNRAFHKNPKIVSELGEVVCRTFIKEKIIPVIKHMPGHGHSTGADPHKGTCHVYGTLVEDCIPFQHIVKTSLPVWGMTNHVIYDGIDPSQPTTLSPLVIQYIRNHIGFKQLLITDALDMKALDHKVLRENVSKALQAGHDAVLYCEGNLVEVQTVLSAASGN